MNIHHMALRVRDCDVAASFYKAVFGLKETRRVETGGVLAAVWLLAGSTVLMLERKLRGKGDEHGSGHVLVFPAPDVATAEETLEKLGIPVTDRTHRTLYFQDPDGHRLGLSAHVFEESSS